MATFDEDEDETFYHQLVKPPPLYYSSNTWSNYSKSNNSTAKRKKAKLVKHSSVDCRNNSEDDEATAAMAGLLAGCNDAKEEKTNFHLSILDLQTLRRDSKVVGNCGEANTTIRLPRQDVFRVHKPGFHISTEKVWFPRDHVDKGCTREKEEKVLEACNNSNETSEESTTLGEEEVEVKLPCRSVSINVVGMPSDNDEVNARPSPCSNDFQETIQTAASCHQPLLLTSSQELSRLVSYGMGSEQSLLVTSNGGIESNRRKKSTMVTSTVDQDVDPDELVEKLSPCCRYRKPAIVSLISVGFIMFITFLVLYWNYHETVHRRMTKKQGYILDHWGKGSPSAAETAVLDMEVEILKEQERESKRKMAQQVDDLLVIDGRPLNTVTLAPKLPTVPTYETKTTTSILSSSHLDSRVD